MIEKRPPHRPCPQRCGRLVYTGNSSKHHNSCFDGRAVPEGRGLPWRFATRRLSSSRKIRAG